MLCVRLVGGLGLDRDGAPVAVPAPARARELLVWLALHPGVHPRGRVAAALRPDAGEDAARQTLRQALVALRAHLTGAELDAGRDHVGLHPGAVRVDVHALLAAAGDGDRDALARLRAPLAPGVEADWLDDARRAHLDGVAGLAARGAADREAAGDLAGALAFAAVRARLEPLSETARREHIRLLAATGDRAAALAAADALRRHLADELGVPPSAETRRLLTEVLTDDRGVAAGPRGPDRRPAGRPPLPGPLVERGGGPLVGRDEVVAQLVDGDGWVLLAGEPGIGKTRCAMAAARALHAGGGAVLFGRCDRDALSPHQPFAEALDRAIRDGLLDPDALARHDRAELARIVPALADERTAAAPGDAEGGRMRLFEAVRAALGAAGAGRRAVLLVDDLHWATPETLALLTHLRGDGPGGPPVWGTFRDTSVTDPAHPLAEALAGWRRDGVRVLDLPPLGPEAVAAFVEWCVEHPDPDLAATLHRRTGGNPLFLVESLRDISERGGAPPDEVPGAVRDVIEQRIARLGPRAVPVLRAAAIAGPEFTVARVEAVTGDEDDTAVAVLEDAVRARLVRELPDTGRLVFTHALVADTILAGMSAARRARLHLRLGAHLAGAGAPAAEVARHLVAASPEGDPAALARWVGDAAEEALGLAAYDRAAELCDRALGHPDLPPAARAGLLVARGAALDRLGRRDEARAGFAEAAALARAAGDPACLARAALGHAGYAVAITDPDPVTVALLREARAADPPPDLAARVHAALACERYYADRDESDRLSREALRLAPDPTTRARVLSARHVVLWRADGADGRLAVADEMRDLAVASGDPVAELQARNWRVVDLLELARFADAEAETTRYEELAARVRLPRYAWYAPLWRGTLAIARGAFEEARALTDEAERRGRDSGDPNAEGHVAIQRTHALLEAGRAGGIDLDAVLARARRSPSGMGAWLGWLAMIAARRGEVATARGFFEELAGDGFAQLPDDANWHAACEAADACVLLGDAPRARVLIDRLAPFASLTPVIARGAGVYRPVAWYLGRLAGVAGDPVAARDWSDRALAVARAVGSPLWEQAAASPGG